MLKRLTAVLCLITSTSALAGSPATDDGPSLRIAEEPNQSIALEIVSRDYVRADGEGPTVTIVGVAHVADRSYYRTLQKHLDEFDIVLYESVMPSGARGPWGKTDDELHRSTRTAMSFVASIVEAHFAKKRHYPANTEALLDFARDGDARLGGWVDRALVDGWGKRVAYTVGMDGQAFSLVSLGADGAEGGDSAAADITIDRTDGVQPMPTTEGEGGMQAELANALGLAFQLEAVDYGADNWVCSDMTFDQLEHELAKRGANAGPLNAALGDAGFPAMLAKGMLRLIKLADAFLDGAITDMIKVVMIEMLGDEATVQNSLDQFDPVFAEVILDERNQVVIDDLAAILEEGTDAETIAIFYGAAHIPDMADRLADQLDYHATEDTWYTAIEVDLADSMVTSSDLKMIRRLFKQSMRFGR